MKSKLTATFFLLTLLPQLLSAVDYYQMQEIRFKDSNKKVKVLDQDVIAYWDNASSSYRISRQSYMNILSLDMLSNVDPNNMQIRTHSNTSFFYNLSVSQDFLDNDFNNTNTAYTLHCYYPKSKFISLNIGNLAQNQDSIYMRDFSHIFSSKDIENSNHFYPEQKTFKHGGSAYLVDEDREEQLMAQCNHQEGDFEIRLKGASSANYRDGKGYPVVIKKGPHTFKRLQGKREAIAPLPNNQAPLIKNEGPINIDDDGFVILENTPFSMNNISVDFARGEKLAHAISYGTIKNGNKEILRNGQNIDTEYTVYLDANNQGDTTTRWYLMTSADELLINFVGTNSLTSLYHDLDPVHAGQNYYRDYRNAIMKLITIALQDQPQITKVVLTGHSLAGALAQYALYDIMSSMVNRPQYTGELYADFSQINDFTILTWNSTGIDTQIQALGKKYAAHLKNNHGVTFKARYGMKSGDFVQKTGGATLFSDSPYYEVDVAVVKGNIQYDGYKGHLKRTGISLGLAAPLALIAPVAVLPAAALVGLATGAYGTVKAHTHYAGLYEDETNKEFQAMELITNYNNPEEVATRLGKKSSFLQFNFIKKAQNKLFIYFIK